MTISSGGASDTGISVAVAPSPTAVPSVTVGAADAATTTSPTTSPPTTSPPTTSPPTTSLTASERLRAALPVTGPGLTGPGGTLLGALIVGLGAVLDLALGGSLDLGFTVTFVVGSGLVALAMRVRALATAVVLPPLLFAGAALLETEQSGATSGNRQAALDVATSLALSAPTLFLGTAVALLVVLVRLVTHAVRR